MEEKIKVPVGCTTNMETGATTYEYCECTPDQFARAMLKILAPAFPNALDLEKLMGEDKKPAAT